jgi:hypothetical protein
MTSPVARAASVTTATVSIAMMYAFTSSPPASYGRPRHRACWVLTYALPPHVRPKRWPVRRFTGHPVWIHSPFCTDTASSVVHRQVRCPWPGGRTTGRHVQLSEADGLAAVLAGRSCRVGSI